VRRPETRQRKRLASLLYADERLYAYVYAVKGIAYFTRAWAAALGLGITDLVIGLAWPTPGLSSEPQIVIGAVMALLGVALLLVSLRWTRLIAFTDRNVAAMDAPTGPYPRRVIERSPGARLTDRQRERGQGSSLKQSADG
jgi:hypothetical protein